MDVQDKIAQFVAVTGAEASQAEHMLEASGGDMDAAVQLHFETSHAEEPVDDEQLARDLMRDDVDPAGFAGAGVPADDFAEPAVDQDGIRVPDAVRTERLFDVGPQMMAARPLRARREALEGAGINLSDGGLDAIYKPPHEIMTDLTLEEIKQEAERKDQWIIVNVQDTSVFQSLQLNADLWHDSLLQDLIKGNFQFAQRTLPSEDAVQLQSSYHLHAMPSTLVIDPNTGQKMHEWTGLPDKERFMEALVPFLDTPPSNPKAGSLVSASVKQATFQTTAPVPTGAAGVAGISDEDEKMAQVIAASLSDRPAPNPDGAGPSNAAATEDSFDAQMQQAMAQSLGEDFPRAAEGEGAAAAPATATAVAVDDDAELSAEDAAEVVATSAAELVAEARARLLARPSRDATARVALQLPNKRVVEKFAPEDTVQSMYDVVRTELAEEQAGDAFELVAASQGAEKLSDMAATVESAGLAGSLLRVAWL